MKLPLAPAAVFDVLRELRSSSTKAKPLVLGGARSLVDALRRELLRDGDASAIRDASLGALDGAAALVYVLAGDPTEEDERALRAADMANVPIVVLGPDPTTPIPYVLATDILPLPPGEGFPLDDLGRLIGAKADDVAAPLAAKLPALRRGIADSLVAKVARQNGLIGAAVFIPGVDFPVLTLNQLRLVMRLATAYGQQLDAQRLPEVLGVVGTGLGLRAIARGAVGMVPVGGWAVKGGVAYTGTRALGEAAIKYFEARDRLGGGGAEPSASGADRP
jgi:uncharacterized protein (DUF697 family)